MKKILIVDHAFHKKTRSADFFVDIVRERFAVQVYYLEPDSEVDPGVLDAAEGADIVILWQMDFLAPLFRSLGKPVIVIPMFDGSGEMPDLHWVFATGARFFNFSVYLNERIRLLGGQTMLLRYFPEPVAETDLPRFNTLDAFFWQRRPDHGISFEFIDSLIGEELDSLHVHNVPDVPICTPSPSIETLSYRYTESSWFKNRSDYDACLAAANVFVAPRVAEGIGMALLEAMARGMLVLAHDAPTNNEYVSNWVNGILFNKNHAPNPIHIRSSAVSLSRMAWQTVVEGRRGWLDSRPAILEWIEGAPAGQRVDIDHAKFYRDLWRSYFASKSSYELFLRRHLSLFERISGMPLEPFLELIGRPQTGGFTMAEFPSLPRDGLLLLTSGGERFIGSGWSSAEKEWRWAIGTTAELHVPQVTATGQKIGVRFMANPLPQLGKVECSIELNGQRVFKGRISPGWREYGFNLDVELLGPENHLILRFDKAASIPGDGRELSVCFKWFRFSDELVEDQPKRYLKRWLKR